jgi:hypothetical protein
MPTIETGQPTQPTTMATSVIATVFENHGYVSKFTDIWVFSFKIYILNYIELPGSSGLSGSQKLV